MKINSIARVAARVSVVGATAVALTLGSTGLAGAEDSTTASATFGNDGSASAERQAPHLSDFRAGSIVVGGKGAVVVGVSGRLTPPTGGSRIIARVYKGKSAISDVDITDSRFEYPNKWGRGTRGIRNVRFTDSRGALKGTDNSAASFAVRSAVKGKLKITSTGSRKSVRAVGKIYSTSKGKYVTAKRVKFQVLSGGKWRTKKTVKLNSKGVGRYSFRASGKKKYRVVIKQTSTVAGAKTRGIRI